MYENFIKAAYEAQSVAIFIHISPDGDTVGAGLGLKKFLENFGITADVYLDKRHSVSDNLSFLPQFSSINNPRHKIKKYDLSVAVDCAEEKRIGGADMAELFYSARQTFVIDHHIAERVFGEERIIESDSAATCLILARIFREFNETAIDKDVATCLFTGLMTDTGVLAFQSVTKECFETAAYLVGKGADNYNIIRKAVKETRLNTFKLRNRVLGKTQYFNDGTTALICFTLEDFAATNTDHTVTEGIINVIIDIKEVNIAFSLTETPEGDYKVSIRTKDGKNAQKIGSYFGGGGHINASGCKIVGETFENAVKMLIDAAKYA
jgi:phosphoesterase RecJ-like protein